MLQNNWPVLLIRFLFSPSSLHLQNLCVDEKRGGKAANQQNSRTGGRAANTASGPCLVGVWEQEGGRSMREAFPSLPYGSPVLDREISKINSNNISSNTGPAAFSGTPRCHSTSPHPPNRGPVEREGEATATTPSPSLGTTITSGGCCSASTATSPVPSHHHLNIIKEGVQTLERDNFLSNISSAESASTDGE